MLLAKCGRKKKNGIPNTGSKHVVFRHLAGFQEIPGEANRNAPLKKSFRRRERQERFWSPDLWGGLRQIKGGHHPFLYWARAKKKGEGASKPCP
ncbi:hypothetical protein CDAR_487101 [Caerostris darwini]|uniref:Uncharacterized protein n=1 Tax=Caerostris darwini TaxID=1538125 RepID=A0AAV4TW51_9ARAC|nr:hypothetical protein CDAR_487101 [Caerostris darwini]